MSYLRFMNKALWLLGLIFFLLSGSFISHIKLNWLNVQFMHKVSNCLGISLTDIALKTLMSLPNQEPDSLLIDCIPRNQMVLTKRMVSSICQENDHFCLLGLLLIGEYNSPLFKSDTTKISFIDPNINALLSGFTFWGQNKQDLAIIIWLRDVRLTDIVVKRLSSIFYETRKLDKVESVIRKLIGYDCNSGKFYRLLGEIYWNSAKPEEAVTAYEQAINQENDYHQQWLMKGNIYAIRSQYSLAIDAYNKAISSDSKDWAAYSALADVYLNLNRKQDAISALQRAHWLAPANSDLEDKLRKLEEIH